MPIYFYTEIISDYNYYNYDDFSVAYFLVPPQDLVPYAQRVVRVMGAAALHVHTSRDVHAFSLPRSLTRTRTHTHTHTPLHTTHINKYTPASYGTTDTHTPRHTHSPLHTHHLTNTRSATSGTTHTHTHTHTPHN